MINIDLAVTSSRPQTTIPSTWPTRHGEVGLTQAWRDQQSYGGPNTGKVGKVDIPQLQAHASPQGPRTTCPDLDTLSSDTTDSLREQVRQVHQWLDEVQKEVLKSRGEIGESSKGDSLFTPEIQGKPLPTTFRLPTLEPYDGSGDPTEHIAACSDGLVRHVRRADVSGFPDHPERTG
ncbi:hypothetical protein BHM03_00011661 [Ensete ventricosum]|nr:hypothetical protein BHM03_00011661 [Ensete ventricosum]